MPATRSRRPRGGSSLPRRTPRSSRAPPQLGVLAVRSSATIEDRDAGSAAGVFSSRRAVPAADVWAAIRAVWTSALTPLAIAYARRRGGDGIATIGVIVQRFVAGDCITAYTRTPAGADEVWIQRGGELARHARGDDDPVVRPRARRRGRDRRGRDRRGCRAGRERRRAVDRPGAADRARAGARASRAPAADRARRARRRPALDLGRRAQSRSAVAGAGRPGRARCRRRAMGDARVRRISVHRGARRRTPQRLRRAS